MSNNPNLDNLVQLKNQLEISFSESELKDICFELDIDFENLSGHTKAEKARELVSYCSRTNKLMSLIESAKTKRPHHSWDFNFPPKNPPSLAHHVETTDIKQNTTNQKEGFNNNILLIVGTGISFFIILVLIAGNIRSNFSPDPNENFLYQVRVQDNQTNQSIDNAKVSIDLPGRTPLIAFTDSTGIAVFHVESRYENEIVQLQIQKLGYADWEENTTIKANAHPSEIRLQAKVNE